MAVLWLVSTSLRPERLQQILIIYAQEASLRLFLDQIPENDMILKGIYHVEDNSRNPNQKQATKNVTIISTIMVPIGSENELSNSANNGTFLQMLNETLPNEKNKNRDVKDESSNYSEKEKATDQKKDKEEGSAKNLVVPVDADVYNGYNSNDATKKDVKNATKINFMPVMETQEDISSWSDNDTYSQIFNVTIPEEKNLEMENKENVNERKPEEHNIKKKIYINKKEKATNKENQPKIEKFVHIIDNNILKGLIQIEEKPKKTSSKDENKNSTMITTSLIPEDSKEASMSSANDTSSNISNVTRSDEKRKSYTKYEKKYREGKLQQKINREKEESSKKIEKYGNDKENKNYKYENYLKMMRYNKKLKWIMENKMKNQGRRPKSEERSDSKSEWSVARSQEKLQHRSEASSEDKSVLTDVTKETEAHEIGEWKNDNEESRYQSIELIDMQMPREIKAPINEVPKRIEPRKFKQVYKIPKVKSFKVRDNVPANIVVLDDYAEAALKKNNQRKRIKIISPATVKAVTGRSLEIYKADRNELPVFDNKLDPRVNGPRVGAATIISRKSGAMDDRLPDIYRPVDIPIPGDIPVPADIPVFDNDIEKIADDSSAEQKDSPLKVIKNLVDNDLVLNKLTDILARKIARKWSVADQTTTTTVAPEPTPEKVADQSPDHSPERIEILI